MLTEAQRISNSAWMGAQGNQERRRPGDGTWPNLPRTAKTHWKIVSIFKPKDFYLIKWDYCKPELGTPEVQPKTQLNRKRREYGSTRYKLVVVLSSFGPYPATPDDLQYTKLTEYLLVCHTLPSGGPTTLSNE